LFVAMVAGIALVLAAAQRGAKSMPASAPVPK
jgi:hypothetical protein